MSKPSELKIDNPRTNPINAPGGPPELKGQEQRQGEEEEEEEEEGAGGGGAAGGRKEKEEESERSRMGREEEEEENGIEKWNFYVKINFKIQTCLFI